MSININRLGFFVLKTISQESIQLVSKSPRRKELLSRVYKEVVVEKFDFDESVPRDIEIINVATYIAEQKMLAFMNSSIAKGSIIITADTIVCYPEEGKILGKPNSIEGARQMLLGHFGKEHQVITSACYMDTMTKKKIVVTDNVKVRFKNVELIPENIVARYLQLTPPYGPMDKAGAYGIQEAEVYKYMIEAIAGDINTVIGFPLEKFVSVVIDSSSGNI